MEALRARHRQKHVVEGVPVAVSVPVPAPVPTPPQSKLEKSRAVSLQITIPTRTPSATPSESMTREEMLSSFEAVHVGTPVTTPSLISPGPSPFPRVASDTTFSGPLRQDQVRLNSQLQHLEGRCRLYLDTLGAPSRGLLPPAPSRIASGSSTILRTESVVESPFQVQVERAEAVPVTPTSVYNPRTTDAHLQALKHTADAFCTDILESFMERTGAGIGDTRAVPDLATTCVGDVGEIVTTSASVEPAGA